MWLFKVRSYRKNRYLNIDNFKKKNWGERVEYFKGICKVDCELG